MTTEKCDLAPDKIVCSGSDLYLFFGNKCVNVGHTNLEERIMQISPILEKLGDQGGTCIWKILTQIILQLPSKKM